MDFCQVLALDVFVCSGLIFHRSFAALDCFRLGTVIIGAAVMRTRAEPLYEAIEELAGQQTSIALLNKVEAAVSTSKVALALNSIRLALKVLAVPLMPIYGDI
jgi:hypothetical protein